MLLFFSQYINTELPRAGSKTDMERKNSLLTVKKKHQRTPANLLEVIEVERLKRQSRTSK